MKSNILNISTTSEISKKKKKENNEGIKKTDFPFDLIFLL